MPSSGRPPERDAEIEQRGRADGVPTNCVRSRHGVAAAQERSRNSSRSIDSSSYMHITDNRVGVNNRDEAISPTS